MPNKFKLMMEGSIEYKSRMEMAIQQWGEAGNGQISDEELANAHQILKNEILDWANGEMAKCWWTERLKWRSFRKIFERDLEKQFQHFREFIVVREELREARQKHAEILKMTHKLIEELANCEGNGATELNEQIQAKKKEEEESLKREEELAKKLEILMKKYEIKMANKMDDYGTSNLIESGGHLAHHVTHLFPAAGLVGASVFLVGTFADFIRRSKKRKNEIRQLDEQLEDKVESHKEELKLKEGK